MQNQERTLLSVSGIEFHYVFEDGMHSMDAFVLNKCESEILAIIKQISKDFQFDIEIDCLPLEEGSLKSIWKAISKSVIVVPLIMNLVASFLYNSLSKSPQNVAREVIEELISNPDQYLKLKEKAELEKDIEILRLKKDSLVNLLNENVIIKRRSNYFDSLNSYQRVRSITISPINEERQHVREKTINRWEFQDYIMDSDDLDPETDEEAVIEIVSPVLKRDVKKTKWFGIYDGAYVPFTMKSNEFKTKVQIGEVSFKNGTAIKCLLEKQRKLDQEGQVKVKSYSVLEVYEIIQNEVKVETLEGRVRRVKRQETKQELSLFDDSQY